MKDLPKHAGESDCSLLVSIHPEASQKKEVLLHLAKCLCDKGFVKSSYAQAVLDREREFPTGLKLDGRYNIALAHAGPEHVYKNAIIVAVLDQLIDFQLMEDPDQVIPVKVVFMFSAVDYDSINQYVNRLVEEILLKSGMVDQLVEQNDKELIYSMLFPLLFGKENI